MPRWGTSTGRRNPVVNNGILINFPTPSGLAGTLSGSATLTPLQLMYLVTGQTYANIHTTNFRVEIGRAHV